MEYQKEAPKNDKQEEKPDMSLLPLDLLEYETRPYQYGCKKYHRNSWRSGFKQSRMIAAALRHISDYWDKGEMFDTEAMGTTGIEVHHVTMAIFNLRCVMDSIINHPQFDDRYRKEHTATVIEELRKPVAPEQIDTEQIQCRSMLCAHHSFSYANNCGSNVDIRECRNATF